MTNPEDIKLRAREVLIQCGMHEDTDRAIGLVPYSTVIRAMAEFAGPLKGGARAVAHHGSANSHVFDDQILVGGECIAFSDEPWTSRIVAALSHTEGKGS